MSDKVKDMTTGSPAKLAVSFAVPLMLGNIFQTMYTMTDTAIVSRFAGVQALGALGSADWLCWLIFGVVSGIMYGFAIPAAQRFGAGDLKGLRRCVSTMLIMSGVLVIVLTALGMVITGPVLRLMGTREELFSDASAYLYILFAGTLFTSAYNLFAGLLRALGNSRVPFWAMIASSVTNIVLDLWFVKGLSWGVEGAAVATVIAQAVASGICLFQLARIKQMRFEKGEFVFDKKDARLLTGLASPMALQQGMIAFGGIAVQTVINSLGFEFVAGFTATNKLYGLMEMAGVSFGYAVATFTGQNLGAKKIARIKKGVGTFALIGAAVSAVMTLIMFIAGRTLLALFIDKTASPEVMEIALRYLKTMAASLSALYLLYVYRSALQGAGDTFMPMISGVAECAGRVGCAWLLTYLVGKSGIYYAESAAWLAGMAVLIVSWYAKQSRLEREIEKAA